MRLLEVSVRDTPGAVRLVGLVEKERKGERLELYFEFPARYRDFVLPSADPFAVAMLVPAMRANERLHVVPPVSPQLLFNLPRVRDVFHAWYANCRRIAVEATPRAEDAGPRVNRAASFFSGGVDSFYTLLKYRGHETLPAPPTHVIFMRGIETKLDRTQGVADSQRRAEEIAAAVGAECIVGESNIRTQFPIDWERYYFGSGLSATALALAGGLGCVCIPSSLSYNHLEPHGSHALVDEKYSTERMQIVHDGAEATRAHKVARIVEWNRDLALNNLRVCMRNAGGAYNCGECYKCVRTAIALRVLGVLGEAPTFPKKSSAHWASVAATDHLGYVEENLAFARERGADPELVAMLEGVARRRRRRLALKTLVKNSPVDRLLPLVGGVRRRLK